MPWSEHMPSGRIAYINGRYLPHSAAAIHIEDRGLQLGDSIYEVVAVEQGRLRDEEEHLDRLEYSLSEIFMMMPTTRANLKFIFRELLRRNHLRNGMLYLQVTRGAHRRDHVIPKHNVKPTLIITARQTDTNAIFRRMAEGISVITLPDERWARCNIKTTQLLPNLLAKSMARERGAYEAWFVDQHGYITEGASTNAWIVTREGKICTRSLSPAILPGVTRQVILKAARQANLPIIERSFTSAEAKVAAEAFITSATAAGLPVVAIDDVAIGNGRLGPICQQIQRLYAEFSRENGDKKQLQA